MSHILVLQPPRVLVSGPDPVVALAARELIRYVTAAAGPVVTEVAERKSLRRRVWRIPPGVEAAIWTDPLRIHATTPAALLRAVYHYLEQMGWRWYFPGPLGEVFRPDRPAPAPGYSRSLPERVMVLRLSEPAPAGWDSEAGRLAAWLPRRGWQALAVEGRQVAPGELAPLADELARRGLALEVGGDIVPRLLAATRHPLGAAPARLPGGRPEVADGAALSALPAVAAAELAAHPTARALRLMEPAEAPLMPDAPGLLPIAGERFAAVVAAVAAGLADAGRVVLWQPELAVRRRLQVAAGVRLAVVRDVAEPSAEPLPQHPGGLEVSLPCADLRRQRGFCAPLLGRLAETARELSAAGVARVSTVVQGAVSWWGYPLNLYALSRLLDDAELSAGDILDDWCCGLFGAVAGGMRRYFTAFENAMEPLWPLRDVPEEHERFGDAASLLRLHRAVDALPAVRRELTRAFSGSDDPLVLARLEREADVFDLNALQVRLRFLRLQAHLGHPTLALHAAARELVSALLDHLARLPAAAVGVALGRDYLELALELAQWCGHETEGLELPIGGG